DPRNASGMLANTATVNAHNELAAEQNARATATITIRAAAVPMADVDVKVAADQATRNAGDRAGFTITIANAGPGDATDITLTDRLPGGLAGDVSWQIDGSTGNPLAFALTGPAGSQLLSLSGWQVALAAGASLAVHVTGLTSAA